MSWSTAVLDLRTLISDGATDKLAYRKQVIGQADGVLLKFKTFEARRISDFTAPTGPVGVFVENVLKTVTADNLESGEFTVQAPAPTEAEALRATYYYQWFNDDELTKFMVDASEWLGFGVDFTNVPPQLRPAALEFGAHKAYQKLVSKMSVNLAETYQLYDAPDQKRFDPVKIYMDISKQKLDMAFKLRNDVYKDRQGQALAPLFGTLPGRVRDVPPKR